MSLADVLLRRVTADKPRIGIATSHYVVTPGTASIKELANSRRLRPWSGDLGHRLSEDLSKFLILNNTKVTGAILDQPIHRTSDNPIIARAARNGEWRVAVRFAPSAGAVESSEGANRHEVGDA